MFMCMYNTFRKINFSFNIPLQKRLLKGRETLNTLVVSVKRVINNMFSWRKLWDSSKCF